MIKQRSIILFLLLGWGWEMAAQVTDPNLPPQRAPKPVLKENPPAQLPEMPAPTAEVPGPDDEIIIPELKGLIFVDALTNIVTGGVPDMSGLDVRGIPLLSRQEFQAVAQKYLGQPLSINGIRRLERDVILYCRGLNRPLVDVIVPGQSVDNGVLQVWFLEGKVSEIVVDNPNTHWFSDKTIRREIRLGPGDVVDAEKLLDDLDWLNRNPFRQVDVLFRQTTNAVGISALGKSDIILKVEDRFPVRVYAGYEDTGTEVTGEDRFLGGFNVGRMFGLDHQFNYQYTTDTDFDLLKAHSGSYDLPLPWRHSLTFFGSYVDAKADYSSIDTTSSEIENTGTSYQASGRYNLPLPQVKRYRHQAVVGFDFKDSDNDLEFGGGATVLPSSIQILQMQASYSGILPDAHGQTSWALEGFYSPGDLTAKNETEDFQELRPGTEADYAYGRVSLERVTRLPLDFSSFLRGSMQLANERLMPSEEFGLGGYRSVRGYAERLANGDQGWTVNFEIRFPSLELGNLLHMPDGRDYIQPLIFFDYGGTKILDPEPGEDRSVDLASVGFGVRYTVSKNLAVRMDWGYQLLSRELSDHKSRAHVGVMMSF